MVAKELEDRMLRNIEAAGYRRKVKHERFMDEDGNPVPKNLLGTRRIIAKTTVTLVKGEGILDDAKAVAKGVAKCSESDSWNRRLGRVIATGRAMKVINIKRK